MISSSLRVVLSNSAALAFSIVFASGVQAQSYEGGQQRATFHQTCPSSYMIFSKVCVGRFDEKISFVLTPPLSASEEDRVLRNSVRALEQLGLKLADDASSVCRALADNAEFVGQSALSDYPIFSLYLDDCALQSGNLDIEKLTVVFTPSGGSIELLEGTFHGSPGNHVDHGPFYEELVKRYGQNKCDEYSSVPRVCFTNTLNQQVWVEETGRPGDFIVRISDKDKRFRREGIEFLGRELKKRENSAPVKSF